MSDKPQMAPYNRHLFICTGQYCDPAGHASRLYERLPQLLGDLADYHNPQRIKRGTTPCLGVCEAGTILVIYPDGTWYHHVDESRLVRIIQEHLRLNQPILEWVFHQLRDQDAKGEASD